MDKTAIYAGSFDPWTAGHQFVLDSALKIFDCIHIVTAVNPAKKSLLNPTERAQIIAHSIDPETNWWAQKPPFYLQSEKIIISADEGLIATYAEEHKIQYLIRGLRSTTDFEAEFNLYFSNHAINSLLQTWAVMCPPKLLHCSATYVKTVVGKQNVKFVGTHFAAQSLMLGWVHIINDARDQIFKRIKDILALDESNRQQIKFNEISVNLDHVEWKDSKTRNSIILKLLHKPDNIVDEVFDYLGVRFVVENTSKIPILLKLLIESDIIIPHQVISIRSRNSILNIKQPKKILPFPRSIPLEKQLFQMLP